MCALQTELFLVRHGESFSNVEGRFCATPPGPGLTERGKVQAQEACRRILQETLRPERIFSSPLRRALETAAPLCSAVEAVPAVRAQLAETAFGAWDGRRAADLRGLSQFDAWCIDPEGFPPPGGESLSQVAARVGDFLRRAAKEHPGETIVAFSHMHALVGFLRELVDQPFGRIEWLPNATIVHARWDGECFRFVDLDIQPAQVGGAPDAAIGS